MPLYPGTVDYEDGRITVDEALKNPTVITERLADLTFESVVIDHLFSTSGQPITGGGVIYSPVTERHLFVEGVTDRQPGDEYPIVYGDRPEAKLARVQDFGGKFAVTDEARRRNNSVDFDTDVTRLANTITKKLNQRAVETLEAALLSGDNTITSTEGWANLNLVGSSPTPSLARPTADFARAQLAADETELGITLSLLLVHPQQRAALVGAYGPDLNDALSAAGLTMRVSSQVPAGTAYMADPGQLGFVDYEQTLTTETWDDREHRQTWVQSFAMPVMGVTSPRSVWKLIALGA